MNIFTITSRVQALCEINLRTLYIPVFLELFVNYEF